MCSFFQGFVTPQCNYDFYEVCLFFEESHFRPNGSHITHLWTRPVFLLPIFLLDLLEYIKFNLILSVYNTHAYIGKLIFQTVSKKNEKLSMKKAHAIGLF